MISQEKLKKLFRYDPSTGGFIRLVSRQGGAKAGDVAGAVNPDRYVRIKIEGRVYMAHRLAFLYMTGSFPTQAVDHINGEEGDNRWANLRDVSQKENCRNRKMGVGNTSGIVGVSRHNATNTWQASIRGEEKRVALGYFDDFFEACCARRSAEISYGYHQNHGRKVPPTPRRGNL